MIPGFGGGLGKWVWQKVWGGLGGWSWRPYVVIPGFGGGLGCGSGRRSGRPYVAIPGFGGGGLGGGSGETVCSDSWVWRRQASPWRLWGCASLGDVSGAAKTQHTVGASLR